jgi:hypothetical protein
MKCCICGTIKNCEPYLNKVFENIEKIGSLFHDYVIILYYDQSIDNTLEILKEYQRKNIKIIFYVNKNLPSIYRTINIAIGRNFCLNYIKQNYIDYNYFIMIDMDDVNCKEIDIDILKKYLYRNDWDGLSFNTTPNYYDLWALSLYPYFLSLYCWDEPGKMSNLIFNNVDESLKKLKENELLKCASAFNGFSIYKTEKFIDCNYDGTLRNDLLPINSIIKIIGTSGLKYKKRYDDCEHRAFHLEAINKNNARIRISPEILFT